MDKEEAEKLKNEEQGQVERPPTPLLPMWLIVLGGSQAALKSKYITHDPRLQLL